MLDAVASDGDRPRHRRRLRAQAFENQIDATEGIEYTRFGQWKFDPTLAPDTAPDLSESRTAIDGFNRVMVDEIALKWGALHVPAAPPTSTAATDAVAAARALDGAVPAGTEVRDPLVLPNYLSSLDIRRSASGLPPVWQVGQYWNDWSANDTSRTVSPQTGHGSPVRACTRSPERFSPLSVGGLLARPSAPRRR